MALDGDRAKFEWILSKLEQNLELAKACRTEHEKLTVFCSSHIWLGELNYIDEEHSLICGEQIEELSHGIMSIIGCHHVPLPNGVESSVGYGAIQKLRGKAKNII